LVRIASAALLITLVLAIIIWLPPAATLAVASLVAAAAAAEVAGLAAHVGIGVPRLFVAAAAALVTLAVASDHAGAAGGMALHSVLLALVVAGGAVALASPPDAGTPARAAVALMAPIYAGMPLGAIATLRDTEGPQHLLFLLLIVAVSDIAQYYTGRTLGRRKLAPIVSPGKTVEGAVGGVAAAALVSALAGPRLLETLPMAPAAYAGLGAGLSLTGIVGDLFESLLKRGAGVKDSSSAIPGHGGVLDRIDSYLFAGPVFYLLMRILVR
jgi:phosphatidate cytidylyltransferase